MFELIFSSLENGRITCLFDLFSVCYITILLESLTGLGAGHLKCLNITSKNAGSCA